MFKNYAQLRSGEGRWAVRLKRNRCLRPGLDESRWTPPRSLRGGRGCMNAFRKHVNIPRQDRVFGARGGGRKSWRTGTRRQSVAMHYHTEYPAHSRDEFRGLAPNKHIQSDHGSLSAPRSHSSDDGCHVKRGRCPGLRVKFFVVCKCANFHHAWAPSVTAPNTESGKFL